MSNKQIKWLVVLVIVFLVIFGGYSLLSYKKGISGELKVGVILPLTGKAANFGEDIRTALTMAEQEIKSDSANVSFTLEYQDDECDPKKAVSAYQYIHDVKKANFIIGPVCSSATLAVAPLAERDRVILITPVSSAETISEAGDFVFRNHTHDKAEIEVLAPYVAKKYKRVAVIYDSSNDAFVLNHKFLTELLPKYGSEVVISIPVAASKGDYRTDLLKLKEKNEQIDAVFVAFLTNDGVVVMKQMNEMGIKKPIFSNKTFGNSDFINNVGKDLAEGIVFAEAYYDKDVNPKFWEEFYNLAKKNPPIWAPQAYDTLKVLSLSFKNCARDTECVKNYLYGIKDYPGAAGSLSFDSKGDAVKKIVVKRIHDGVICLVDDN
ncbi:MAG: ABC transporter substrate-binding protein [bacterium]